MDLGRFLIAPNLFSIHIINNEHHQENKYEKVVFKNTFRLRKRGYQKNTCLKRISLKFTLFVNYGSRHPFPNTGRILKSHTSKNNQNINFMKKLFLFSVLLFCSCLLHAQEFTLVTTIESVVPGGLGRSRMITTTSDGQLKETPMENFFSLVGINFGNVRQNDQAITDKITQMTKEGWELTNVNSGVYSGEKSVGIFVTRYLFKRNTAK